MSAKSGETSSSNHRLADFVAESRRVTDDAFAQEIEACAAVHLSFDRFDLVDSVPGPLCGATRPQVLGMRG